MSIESEISCSQPDRVSLTGLCRTHPVRTKRVFQKIKWVWSLDLLIKKIAFT